MCKHFPAGGGTSVLVYASEETESDIIHKWDFEDGVQNWKVSGWGEENVTVTNKDGKTGINFKGDTSKDWLSAGIEQESFDGINSTDAEKISVDFYYNKNSITQGKLAVQAYVTNNVNWSENIIPDNTIEITDNESLDIVDTGNGIMKVNLSFNLDKTKLTGTAQIGKMGFLAASKSSDYNGDVYFDNITIHKAASTTEPPANGFVYNFNDNTTQNWNVSGWTLESMKDGMNLANDSGRLKAMLDFTDKKIVRAVQTGYKQVYSRQSFMISALQVQIRFLLISGTKIVLKKQVIYL